MAFTNYHSKYRYPWRYAIPAEVCWRLEHIGNEWLRYDGRPLAPIKRWGYRHRKGLERAAYKAMHGVPA